MFNKDTIVIENPSIYLFKIIKTKREDPIP